MPEEIDAFLTAYRPRPICIPCLAQVTGRTLDDVRKVMTLLLERRAESQLAECMNCGATAFVVRRR
jgi:hypothetical protein